MTTETTMCARCDAYGETTPATTTAPAIINEGGEFVRTGEELPSCESCRPATMEALGEDDPEDARALGSAAADLFAAELPGELPEGDWDAEAFAVDRQGRPGLDWEAWRAGFEERIGVLTGNPRYADEMIAFRCGCGGCCTDCAALQAELRADLAAQG